MIIHSISQTDITAVTNLELLPWNILPLKYYLTHWLISIFALWLYPDHEFLMLLFISGLSSSSWLYVLLFPAHVLSGLPIDRSSLLLGTEIVFLKSTTVSKIHRWQDQSLIGNRGIRRKASLKWYWAYILNLVDSRTHTLPKQARYIGVKSLLVLVTLPLNELLFTWLENFAIFPISITIYWLSF